MKKNLQHPDTGVIHAVMPRCNTSTDKKSRCGVWPMWSHFWKRTDKPVTCKKCIKWGRVKIVGGVKVTEDNLYW